MPDEFDDFEAKFGKAPAGDADFDALEAKFGGAPAATAPAPSAPEPTMPDAAYPGGNPRLGPTEDFYAPGPARATLPSGYANEAVASPGTEVASGSTMRADPVEMRRAEQDNAKQEIVRAFRDNWIKSGRTAFDYAAKYDPNRPEDFQEMLDWADMAYRRTVEEFKQRKGELALRDISGAAGQGAVGFDAAAAGSSEELMAMSRADASLPRKIATTLLGLGGAMIPIGRMRKALSAFGRTMPLAESMAIHSGVRSAVAGGDALQIAKDAMSGYVQGSVGDLLPIPSPKTGSAVVNASVVGLGEGAQNVAGGLLGRTAVGDPSTGEDVGRDLLLGIGLGGVMRFPEAKAGAAGARSAKALGMARRSAAESQATQARLVASEAKRAVMEREAAARAADYGPAATMVDAEGNPVRVGGPGRGPATDPLLPPEDPTPEQRAAYAPPYAETGTKMAPPGGRPTQVASDPYGLGPKAEVADPLGARPVPGEPGSRFRLTGDPEAGYAGDVPAEDSAPRVGMARGNPVKSIYEWGRDRLRAAFGESGARLADRGNPVGDRIAVEIDTARVHARELAADNEDLAANVIHAARPKGVGGRAVNDLAQTPAKGFVTDDGAISTATAMRQYGMEPENAKMAALRDAEGAFSAGFWNSQAARGGTRTEGGVDVPMRHIEGPGKKLPNLSNDLDMEITETGPTHPLWETRIRADAQVQRLVGGSASEPQIRKYYEARHEARSKDSNMVADEGHMASEFTRPFERAEFIRGEDGTLVPLLEVNPAKRAERVLKEGSVTFGMQMMVGRGKASRIDKMRKEFVEAEVRLRGSTPKQANADFTIAMRAGYGINPRGGSPLEPLDTRHGTYPRVIADTWDTTVQALRAMARSTAMATQAPSDLLTGNQAVPIGAANNLRAVAGTIWNALKSLAGKGETAAMKEARSLGLKTANPHNRTTSTHVPQDAARAQIRAFGDKTARPADEGQESAAAMGIPMWLKGLSNAKEWNQFFKAQARMRLEIYGRSSRAEADAYLWGRMTPDKGVAYLKRMGHSIASSTTGSNLDRAQMSQFDQHPAVKKLFTFYRWFGQNLKITGRTLETYGREMGNLRTPGPDGAPVTKAQMAQRAAAANVELGRFMVYRALNGAMMKAMWAIFTGNEEQEWERFKKNPVGYLLKAMVETSVAGPAGALGMGILEGHVSLNNLLPVKVFRAGMDMAEVAFDAGILLGPVPALFGIGGQDPKGAALKAGATAEKLMPLIRAGTRSGFSEALKKHEAAERLGMARGR